MPPVQDPEAPEGTDPPVDDNPPATGAALNLTPDAIRNSPEFQALQRENRKLARQKGAAETAAAAARTAAEEARQAAEAQQQAALEAEIVGVLGEEGVAFWDEFSALSASDPRAAARRLAEKLAEARAQSSAGGDEGDPAGGAPAAGEEGTVPPAQTPPPPSRGVDGSVPIGAATTGEDQAAVVARLEGTYAGVVERVQDPVTRNRVTMRERASGFIAYLAGAYVQAGATPKDRRE